MTTAMFRKAWDAISTRAQENKLAAAKQLKDIDRDITKTLDRILDASNTTVIARYEAHIAELEKRHALMAETAAKKGKPKASYEEQLELSLRFLANPWKLWETGHIALRRTVLKLAFTEPVRYCRNEGARTPTVALPFKALGAFKHKGMLCGAGRGTRTPDPLITNQLLYQLS